MKDDSGSYAVFTEQGSSASQMTAVKVMDVIARQPGCGGQAADAVLAYAQVEMKNAPKILKLPMSECEDIWIRPPRYKWPKSWSNFEEPVVLVERNLFGYRLAGSWWERQFENVEKVPNSECLLLHRKQGLFLSVYVDDIKMAGRN